MLPADKQWSAGLTRSSTRALTWTLLAHPCVPVLLLTTALVVALDLSPRLVLGWARPLPCLLLALLVLWVVCLYLPRQLVVHRHWSSRYQALQPLVLDPVLDAATALPVVAFVCLAAVGTAQSLVDQPAMYHGLSQNCVVESQVLRTWTAAQITWQPMLQ